MTEFIKSADIFIPKHLAKRHYRSVCFWYSPKLNRITVGLPEEYPVPAILQQLGFEKRVCRHAYEVEFWSDKLRDQERREAEMDDEARWKFEGPLRTVLRQDLITRMMNSRNAINRDFCRAALERMDKEEERQRMRREAYQHIEAFEQGH